jgi:TRAP-type C4-dicarboxylate transport system permease small subunit
MMLYYGWKMAALQVATQQKTIIMQIPLVYLYAFLPIMGTTMILRTIQIMHQDFQASASER